MLFGSARQTKTIRFSFDFMMTIYRLTTLPIMEYANIIYTLYTVTQNRKLQRLKNRALNIVYYPNRENLSVTEMHQQIPLESIAGDRQLLGLMYRHSKHPDKFKRFPQYQWMQLWDRLEASTQRAPTYTGFKTHLPRSPNLIVYPVA